MIRPSLASRRPTSGRSTALAAVWLAAAASVLALPAAGQTSRPPPDDAVIQTAAPGRAAGDHEAFRTRMHSDMAEWRRKMEAFDQTVATGSERRRDAVELRVRDAWNHTEIAARDVDGATARQWHRVKATYEAASRRLAKSWEAMRL